MPEPGPEDFERARLDLLDRIQMPALATVQRRARVLRRRRRGLALAAAALACLVALGMGTLVLGQRSGVPSPAAASASGDAGSVWRGGGLTLYGLTGPVLDLPGDLRDVQFADRQHGYALATACTGGICRVTLGASTDGGQSWAAWSAPTNDVPLSQVPALVTLASQSVLLVQSDGIWVRPDGPDTWHLISPSNPTTVAAVPPGGRLWQEPSTDCVPGGIRVFGPDGTPASLATTPALDVCWVAPAPALDGSWWVGGRVPRGQGTAPAVAVSRDDGRSWHVSPLPGPDGAWGQVSVLGTDVFASVLSLRGGNPYPETRTIHAVYRSAAGGAFTPYAGSIGTLIGDVVPLLDGRLAAAGPNWYLSTGSGAALSTAPTPAGGSMPWVYRVQRTAGCWVAYNLFQAGWAAISTDGESWRKINLR
jgi:hypothetical protein